MAVFEDKALRYLLVWKLPSVTFNLWVQNGAESRGTLMWKHQWSHAPTINPIPDLLCSCGRRVSSVSPTPSFFSLYLRVQLVNPNGPKETSRGIDLWRRVTCCSLTNTNWCQKLITWVKHGSASAQRDLTEKALTKVLRQKQALKFKDFLVKGERFLISTKQRSKYPLCFFFYLILSSCLNIKWTSALKASLVRWGHRRHEGRVKTTKR